MQGVDLIEMLNNKLLDRKEFFYEHTYLGSPRLPKVEGVIAKDFKYMKYIEHNYEEFYDLKNDSDEKQNIAKNADYHNKLVFFQKKYITWKKQVQ